MQMDDALVPCRLGMWLCPWCWPVRGLAATFLSLVLEADSRGPAWLALAVVLTRTPVHDLSKVLAATWCSPIGAGSARDGEGWRLPTS